MPRALIASIVACLVLIAAPASARPYWKQKIDRIVAGKQIGVALHDEGRVLYQHADKMQRTPASNEKLLLTMALYDRVDPSTTLETIAFSETPANGSIAGDLWVGGRGDPTITDGGAFGRSLPFPPTRVAGLARAIADAGIVAISGSVMGHVGYFQHDWYAPGWQPDFPRDEVALPSALTFEGNTRKGRHIERPEVRFARALTRRLEGSGIPVAGAAGSGSMPAGLERVAAVDSPPLSVIARFTNRHSSNFFAEVLGKRLGVEAYGRPGTIAKGGRAIERWAQSFGVDVEAKDGSGLSYSNRVSPRGLVRLLTAVEETAPYYETIRRGLPGAGQGTLEDRLGGVRLRAKTGSLDGVSALSGWVWLERTSSWAEFSILSGGMTYHAAKDVEDRIMRVLSDLGR